MMNDIMDTLPGFEDETVGKVRGAQEQAARAFVREFYADLEPNAWDKVYASTLIQIAISIDNYISVRKNPATLFDTYNQTLDKIEQLHTDALTQVDDDLAQFTLEAHK